MVTIWALVANSSFAQIYEIKGRGKDIKELHVFENPTGRLKMSEMTSDRQGRSAEFGGTRRHALTKEVDPHEHELRVFLKRICDILKKAKADNRFEELALIAPSHVLGEINQIIDDKLKKAVVKEVHKDLPPTIQGKQRISQLCDYLDLWNRV